MPASTGGLKRFAAAYRSALLPLLLVLVAAMPACAPSEWQELAISDAGFSVLMRGQPRFTRQQLDTSAGKMYASLYSSHRPDDSFFAVGYSDYPLALTLGAPPEQLFAGVRDTWVRRIEGAVVASDGQAKLNGKYPALDFTAEGQSKGVATFVQARLFLVDQRLYQLIAMGRKGEVPQGVVNRFLRSFRLIETREVGTVDVGSAGSK